MLPLIRIPDSFAQTLRIGTCSWKYDSWKGLIYDQGKTYQPYDYLSDYVQYFNTVEIDQWFWSLFPTGVKLPSPGVVQRYSDSVPDDFRFSIKAPNAITLTHYYTKQPKNAQHLANQPNPYFLDTEILERFLETLEPARSKLGPIMFQFEYLNKQKMPSLQAFVDILGAFFDRAPKGYHYAVESRNPNYQKDPFFALLKGQHVSCVLLEGYYMPPIGEITPKCDVLTGNALVVRLHGPDRSKIEKRTKSIWNEIVEPRESSLSSAAGIIKASVSKESDIYVNVNNHYEGCAPLTIQRLMERHPWPTG
jgi:uncharacterized protein YecE (DUF72 family)